MRVSEYYSSDEIIEGIKNNNAETIHFIYRKYYPVIERILLKQFNATKEEIRDSFQEALLCIFNGLNRNPPLKIKYRFIAFIICICKRKLIINYRQTYKEVLKSNFENEPGMELTIDDFLIQKEKIDLFKKHFEKIGEKCRQLLTLFLEGFSIDEIKETLNMSSIQYTKKRRLECKISLFRSLSRDVKLKELIDGKPWSLRSIPRW